ncbi:TonB-dependent hemoglobin/transferrin/lactoferrin family receptor [Chromobacterium sp. IIBBL 290-4]|uniref:TonB-dependent hemoglobin/transferrin/lactoferrin family receptor n=1 Tax=Chromobacterium sp. IIBBL 290-4 TaxID=2953890 RepID=UPI0020B8C995|nr:TonB-dependent hemoglobin/transferrin/lactoferrin family receptor [Chromobacterium sp. IIBBL 290-4]UTH76690.1 TonB-dependent hemoglobin/transferrin/lactoferrin family receptor [Chromobacterium sp. IIBBL 290-4]
MALFRATPIVLSLAAAWPAFADSVPQMETVQVTAHRTEKPLAETAPNASVISRHKLDDRLIRDISDAAKYEPGVDVAADPARRGNAGWTIRGIDGNRILMLIDGVRLPEGYSGRQGIYESGRDFVELETLRAIDIVKGPTSSLYGSDAIGGVIGYRTLAADDFVPEEQGLGGSVKTFGSTADNSWGAAGAFAAKSERGDVLLHYTHRNTHALENQGENGAIGPNRTQANPKNGYSDNILAKFGANAGANRRLELTLEQYQRSVDTDLLNQATPRSPFNQAQDHTKRTRGVLAWKEKQLGPLDELTVKIYGQQLENSDQDVSGVANGRRTWNDYGFEQKTVGLSLDTAQSFQAWGAQHQLLWGADISGSDTSRPRSKYAVSANNSATLMPGYPSKLFPDSRSDRLGVFVSDDIKFANGVVVSPALRWDHYKMNPQMDAAYLLNNPNPQNVPSFSDQAFSPKLGISLPFAANYTAFAQLSSGFRAPPFDQANMVFVNRSQYASYQVLANPNLKSETSRGVELGLKGKWDSFDLAATTFYNRYRDFISLVTLAPVNGLMTTQYQNIGRADIKGAEAKASWRFAPGWSASASLAYAHGRNLQDGAHLREVAPFTSVWGLRYDADRFGGEALVRAVAAKKVDKASEFGAPGYATLDLTAYWKPAKQMVVRAGVFNLLDKKYWKDADVRNVASRDPIDQYTQPGRNVSASVEYQF